MKKLVISLSMAAMLVTPVFAFADHTTAHTIQQLQVQIASLQEQIAALQGESGLHNGDRVQVDVSYLKIRGDAGIGALMLKRASRGETGILRCDSILQNQCPVTRDNYTWWYIDWDNSALPNGWSAEGTSEADFLTKVSGKIVPSIFSASPTSGSAPLAVMFYSDTQSGMVNFGDGTPSAQMECDTISATNSSSVSSACLRTFTKHTYTAPGTYTAKLIKTIYNDCQATGTTSCAAWYSREETIGTVIIKVTSDGTAQQPLTVISPNGGEQWQKGTTQNINWSTHSSVSSVNISLEAWYACLYTYPSCAIAVRPYTLTASTQNDGVFEWGVGKDASGNDIPAGQYMVTVSGGAFYDVSDKPFSIVAPGTIVAPTISSLQPTSGMVGTSVTITGTGFTLNKTGSGCEGNTSYECAAFWIPSNTVRFGPVTISNVQSYDGKTLYFQVPSQYMPPCPVGMSCVQAMSQVGPGIHNVSVSNANGASNAVNFTVTSKTGTLSINPTSAGIKVGGATEFQALFDNCPSGAQCFVGPLPVRAIWASSPKVASVAYKEIPCPAGSSCFVQQFDYLTAVVTGIALGSATITAAYTDSSGAVFTASAIVTTVMP